MAELTGRTVSDLPAATTIVDEYMFAARDSNGTSRKVSWALFKERIENATNEYTVRKVQITGMAGNNATDLVTALTNANSSIPTGVSVLYVGGGQVANRCMVLCSKVNATLGAAVTVSSYSMVNGLALSLSSNGWSVSKTYLSDADTIALDRGGTGANTLAGARTNLGITDQVVVQSFTASSALTISAGGYAAATIPCAKTGYTPIGIVGVNKAGSQITFCVMVASFLNGNTATVGWRNTSSGSDASVTTTVNVLFKKN